MKKGLKTKVNVWFLKRKKVHKLWKTVKFKDFIKAKIK